MRALFQKTLEPLSAERVAEAVAPVDPGADALSLVRRAHGILLDGLTPDAAARIAESLSDLGVTTQDQAWVAPPPRRVVRRAELGEAFCVYDYRGQVTRIPWSEILLLAAGRFADEGARKDAPSTEGRRELSSLRVEGAPPSTPRRAALDVVVDAPVRRLRIEAGAFDYRCLGDERADSAAVNFARLCRSIAGRAGHAPHNRGLRALLSEGEALDYEQAERFERETSWWLWHVFGGERERYRPASEEPGIDPAALLAAERSPTDLLKLKRWVWGAAVLMMAAMLAAMWLTYR